MKRLPWTLHVATVVAALCNSPNFAPAAETNVLQWPARHQLTPDQQKLLQLQKSVETSREDSPLHAESLADIAVLQKKLGPLAVRQAKPGEIVMSAVTTNVCILHN